MRELELLAPARNADIGIAAIDCGADAVYIAGPGFGARQAAGNPVEDIRRLCTHAHRFGARVFVVINTILFDEELEEAGKLAAEVIRAGADALIVQDLAMLRLAPEAILHASTQCAIRTPEKARFLASLGYSRLILEREMSLEQIRAISEAAPECELEFFVHGALCVCYSGQCYLSENIAGRSANRGACIQACRSRYDLVTGSGKVLVKDKALLSLKDYRLLDRLEELADAGVSSFKIEGRLKNESYVRNVVREYSQALDSLVEKYPERYCRASFGKVVKAFRPALDKTFNRGYTELFIDGVKKRGWASMDAAKGMGEEIGKVISVKQDLRRGSSVIEVETPAGCVLNNGDGFSFVSGKGDAIGFRGDVCERLRNGVQGRSGSARIVCRYNEFIYKGARLFRNLDSAFEKEIARNPGTRELAVSLEVSLRYEGVAVKAVSEDGRKVDMNFPLEDTEMANNVERIRGLVEAQLSKTVGIYRFGLASLDLDYVPLLSSAFLNGIRREIAEKLDAQPCRGRKLLRRERKMEPDGRPECSYKANISNRIAREILAGCGADAIEPAYETAHQKDAELMRTRYCIRKELGLCLLEGGMKDELFLLNNGRRLRLGFDCKNCEMTVREA